jgi:pyruvate-formate lyase-activating enzyme
MLFFSEAGTSYKEVPGEHSLVIHISGCPNACENCFSPWLQNGEGDVLKDIFQKLLYLYHAVTCVCFLGEGDEGNRVEFADMCTHLRTLGIKFWKKKWRAKLIRTKVI